MISVIFHQTSLGAHSIDIFFNLYLIAVFLFFGGCVNNYLFTGLNPLQPCQPAIKYISLNNNGTISKCVCNKYIILYNNKITLIDRLIA